MSIKPFVDQYIAEALLILQSRGHAVCIDEVTLNSRLSTTLGRATQFGKLGKLCYRLTISSKAFTSDSEQLKETVFHEVAHIADHQLYGGWGHGRTWKNVMYMLGQEPNRCATEADMKAIGYTIERKRHPRYTVVCQSVSCDKTYNLTSQRVKKLHAYKCGVCSSKLMLKN